MPRHAVNLILFYLTHTGTINYANARRLNLVMIACSYRYHVELRPPHSYTTLLAALLHSSTAATALTAAANPQAWHPCFAPFAGHQESTTIDTPLSLFALSLLMMTHTEPGTAIQG